MSTTADLVIVGGGIAGLVAACAAVDAGLATVLVEQGTSEEYECNTRYSGGVLHIAHHDPLSPPEELAEVIVEDSKGFVSAERATLVARNGGNAIRWLEAHGVVFGPIGPEPWQRYAMKPLGLRRPGFHWQGRGPAVALNALTDYYKERNGTLRLGFEGADVRVDRRKIHLRSTESETIIGGAVILADGGFQGNHELVRAHIAPNPSQLVQRGSSASKGFAMSVAKSLGASTTGLGSFYGHLLSRDAIGNPRLWPFPIADSLAMEGVLVDTAGLRFADEGLGGVYLANVVARKQDPGDAIAVLDAEQWQRCSGGLLPPNPHIPKEGGTVWQAASVGELASIAGLRRSGLESTIETYNAAVGTARADRLAPPRSGAYSPVASPPFYAIPLCVGITYTQGGPQLDRNGRLVNAGGPIDGVYAAGVTAGGYEGGPFSSYVGGLIRSSVTALNAAQHAAAYISGRA